MKASILPLALSAVLLGGVAHAEEDHDGYQVGLGALAKIHAQAAVADLGVRDAAEQNSGKSQGQQRMFHGAKHNWLGPAAH
jgi:hypothetical protein